MLVQFTVLFAVNESFIIRSLGRLRVPAHTHSVACVVQIDAPTKGAVVVDASSLGLGPGPRLPALGG